MTTANWKTQAYNVVQSLLFNNPNRVIEYHVRDANNNWQNRADNEAPVRRLYDTETPPERSCLETIQFVHHMLIPPGGQHVAEPVVRVGAQLIEKRGVFGEDICKEDLHCVSEDDRIGHLHHRGLEMKREQHTPLLCVPELGLEKLDQGALAHECRPR